MRARIGTTAASTNSQQEVYYKSHDLYWNNLVCLSNYNGSSHPGNSAQVTNADPTGKSKAAYGFNGFVTVNTTDSKSGYSTSVKNSGTSSGGWHYLTPTTPSDWELPGEFTIEFWYRPTSTRHYWANKGIAASVNATSTVTNLTNPSNFQWAISTNDSSVVLSLSIDGSIKTLTYTNNLIGLMPANIWHHVAFSRDIDGIVRWFVDGVLIKKSSESWNGVIAVPANLRLFFFSRGWFIDGDTDNCYATGAVDDVRITKGVCRYDTDYNCRVPTQQFPTQM